MKIKSITLDNFRGFPHRETIPLDNKNLLLYGENGAGKSSVFHSLREFFTRHGAHSSAPRNRLENQKNIFQLDRAASVSVEFADGIGNATWDVAGHPTQNRYGVAVNQRVVNASLTRACLDYRALLDTNYRHGTAEPNLFEIAVSQLLVDHRVSVAGRWTTIGEMWSHVKDCAPSQLTQNRDDREARIGLEHVDRACDQFNSVFRGAIEELRAKALELFELFGQGGVEIQSFRFANVSYDATWDRGKRRFVGNELGVNLAFHGQRIERAQLFLNEARLSALALAIYLAGRLTSVPTDQAYVARGDTPPFRLLVLDDVLVGIDHSNRLPLLRVLETKFADWQIVLLTHDRVWFEMARFEIRSADSWRTLEIYEGATERVDAENTVIHDGTGNPILIPAPRIHADHYNDLNLPNSLLEHASRFLDRGYLPAAANYTRAAYEAALKTTCHEFKIPVLYNVDPKLVKVDSFHGAVMKWLDTKPQERKHDLRDAMNGVQLYYSIILNPLSHSLPWTLTKQEIIGAIRAVERLKDLRRAADDVTPERLNEVRGILSKPAPTRTELKLALSKMRSTFHSRLDTYCEGKVQVRYSRNSPGIQALWGGMIALRPTSPPSLVDFLNDNQRVEIAKTWLVDMLNDPALTRELLEEILNAVSPDGSDKLVFDPY